MRRYDFIIAYDIADVKRLRKIARVIEKQAMRIQYSVYIFYDATHQELTALLNSVTKIYNEKYDDIRVYKVKNRGLHFRAAVDLNNPLDFL